MGIDSTTIHCVLLSQAFGNTSCFIACVTTPREDCSSESIDMFNMLDTVNIANLPHNEVFYFTAIAVITHTSVSTLIHRGILKSGNVYKWPYTNRRYTFSIIIILCMLCFFLDIKNNPFDCGLVLTLSLIHI